MDQKNMSDSSRHHPRTLSAILSDLFTTKGYGRMRAMQQLEAAWNEAVGEPDCRQTQVAEVRRGVLEVTVAHPTLLEDLRAFRKAVLLRSLHQHNLPMVIRDIRFRVGQVYHQDSRPCN
jgi:predicted nucleic acid-binding Zn ribbon protein